MNADSELNRFLMALMSWVMLIFFSVRVFKGRKGIIEQSVTVVGLYYWMRYQIERTKRQIPDLVAMGIFAVTTYQIILGSEHIAKLASVVGFVTASAMAIYHLYRFVWSLKDKPNWI